jgi:hypothetical protein
LQCQHVFHNAAHLNGVHDRQLSVRRHGQAQLHLKLPAEPPKLYHLKRLPQATPTRQHPWAGLWVADFGRNDLQILQLSYDFRGACARLRACKVTGDDSLPAGVCAFHCAAAALRSPYHTANQQLVAQQESRWHGSRSVLGERAAAEPTAAQGHAGAACAQPPRVVAIHEGSGQVAGPASPAWVDGKLLVGSDGRLCFVWLEGLPRAVDMCRLQMPG